MNHGAAPRPRGTEPESPYGDAERSRGSAPLTPSPRGISAVPGLWPPPSVGPSAPLSAPRGSYSGARGRRVAATERGGALCSIPTAAVPTPKRCAAATPPCGGGGTAGGLSRLGRGGGRVGVTARFGAGGGPALIAVLCKERRPPPRSPAGTAPPSPAVGGWEEWRKCSRCPAKSESASRCPVGRPEPWNDPEGPPRLHRTESRLCSPASPVPHPSTTMAGRAGPPVPCAGLAPRSRGTEPRTVPPSSLTGAPGAAGGSAGRGRVERGGFRKPKRAQPRAGAGSEHRTRNRTRNRPAAAAGIEPPAG